MLDQRANDSDQWPEPWFATASDGTRLAVHELGTGPAVVLLHGFPELARSWRYQLPALAAAGFRVLAPDQRGCGASDIAEDVTAYDVHHLTGDVVAILDAAEIDRAVLVGHDAAMMTAQWTAYLHPDRVLGIAGMAPPFMPSFPMSPVELMRSLYGERHQFVAFQEPEAPERVLQADVQRSLRNLERNWRTTQGTDPHLHAPVLYLRGEHGDQVPDFAALVFEDYVDDFEWHLLEGIGHWTQQEAPDLVNELLVAWLDRILSDVVVCR